MAWFNRDEDTTFAAPLLRLDNDIIKNASIRIASPSKVSANASIRIALPSKATSNASIRIS